MTSFSTARLVLLAGLAFSAPALAQTDPVAPVPKKEKKTCRRIEVTGSIIGSKAVCHTKTEWAAIDAANAKSAEGAFDKQRQAQTDLNRTN